MIVATHYQSQQNHIAQLCKEHNIIYQQTNGVLGPALHNGPIRNTRIVEMAYADIPKRQIVVGELNYDENYYSALHEIGHIVSDYAKLDYNWSRYHVQNLSQQYTLIAEVEASRWAMQNNLCGDNQECLDFLSYCYSGHYNDILNQCKRTTDFIFPNYLFATALQQNNLQLAEKYLNNYNNVDYLR